jgi:polyhydroxybutyrate depolymerase
MPNQLLDAGHYHPAKAAEAPKELNINDAAARLQTAGSDAHTREQGETAPESLWNRIMAPKERHDQVRESDKISAIKPGETTLEHINLPDGTKANYRLHVPKDYDGTKPLPVVIMFHGYGIRRGQGDTEKGAEGFEVVSNMSNIADREQFIAVYPDGNPSSSYSWNNGQWFFSKRNDVAFTKGMMDVLEANLNVDKERMYLLGYSQGGSFTHSIGNKLSGRIAAAVENGGWMSGMEKQPESPYPMMTIQSIADSVARFEGSPWYNIEMKPEAYTTDFYARANGINGPGEVSTRVGEDGSQVKDVVFRNPQTGAEVRTVLLEKQKHLWFGGIGAEVAPINASEEAWAFLKRFRKPQPQKDNLPERDFN